MTAATLIGFVVTGMIAGLTAGLIGVGGGVVTVPFLDFLWTTQGASDHQAFAVARGTSLAIMVFTSLSAAYGHWRQRAVRLDWTMRLAVGGFFGAVVGSYLGTVADASVTRGAFGILAIAVGARFLTRRKGAPRNDASDRHVPGFGRRGKLYPVGFLVGLFAAFFGVGGGVISVPILTRYFGFRIHQALGTSSALIVALGLVGAASFAVLGLLDGDPLPGCVGYVHLPAVVLVAAGSVVFAGLGVLLAHRLPGNAVERIFGLYALGIGFKMLFL